MKEKLSVEIEVPDGTDTQYLMETILELGWESLHDRGSDIGWQTDLPTIFDKSPYDVVYKRFKVVGVEVVEHKQDWRVGLSCKPVLRTHRLYYERGTIAAVFGSGHGNLWDDNGVLSIRMESGQTFLARASEWQTA